MQPVKILLAFTVLALSAPARAAPGDFTAIKIDEGLVYVDIGRKQGVAPGQAMEVVAREGNGDEAFHLGWIVLESCGESVSMARIPAELKPHVKEGTIVRMPGAPTMRVQPAAPPPPPAPPKADEPHVPPTPLPASVPQFRHEAPKLVPPGVPLTLSVYAPEPLANPVLMYRTQGERQYEALPFKPQPDSYFIVQVPEDKVQAPGLQYYIVVDADAPRRLAFATPEQPANVEVEGRFNETTELSRYGVRDEIATTSELVSYHSSSGQKDYYYRLEGEYLHRIFKTVYSMRFGAGYLAGQAVDGNMMPANIGFLYAYSEAELRSSVAPIAFIPRVIFGVNDSGVGGGFEGRVRIGDELGMNFESGITVLSRLGFETFTTLAIHPTAKTRVALSAYLENLPFANELGFRSYADLRYRFARATSAMVRLGVAARSIDTIGPDTGVGVTFGF